MTIKQRMYGAGKSAFSPKSLKLSARIQFVMQFLQESCMEAKIHKQAWLKRSHRSRARFLNTRPDLTLTLTT